MAISLTGLDQPFRPEDVLRDTRETRIRGLLARGIAKDRISFVTRMDCGLCHGCGTAFYEAPGLNVKGAIKFVVRECPECPGVCVDGKPIVAPAR